MYAKVLQKIAKLTPMVHFRGTLILVVCIALYIAGATAQESDTLDEKGIVRGYIIDTTPAQLPIAGVRVQIDNGEGHIFETTTAETGVFVYTDIPADDYLINIHKSGYQSRMGKPLVVTSGGVHSVPLTMNKQEDIFTKFRNLFRSEEQQGGTLQLQVTTPSPQSVPIENAKVTISQIRGKGSFPTNNIRITDASGEYRHDNLPSGHYFVTVRKDSYHTTFPIPVEENRMVTAAVEFPISNGTADINVLPPHETETKWVIRGKIFEIDFQQTPVSDVEVRIRGSNLKHPKVAYSNADGEYEFGLLPEHYSIFLDKDGYEEDASVRTEVAVKIRQSSVTVIKEGMFVVYETVAKGNVLALKHGISRKSFFKKYGKTIEGALFGAIISGILSFFISRYLNKRQPKHSWE
ncbi:MAG: carboxypeptidase-like regulatory domain-containing protein [Candidatus Poribacteria bacterium]|nr:carboxypeptidase-like regulatory domain-containing protein [Candidatus Poribacteria bacterium]